MPVPVWEGVPVDVLVEVPESDMDGVSLGVCDGVGTRTLVAVCDGVRVADLEGELEGVGDGLGVLLGIRGPNTALHRSNSSSSSSCSWALSESTAMRQIKRVDPVTTRASKSKQQQQQQHHHKNASSFLSSSSSSSSSPFFLLLGGSAPIFAGLRDLTSYISGSKPRLLSAALAGILRTSNLCE